MFIVGMLSWWYSVGWKKLGSILIEKLATTEDFFSIDRLLMSLFSPYKQISASNSSRGTFQDKVRDWFDKQFSRVFGAIIRLILIVVGSVWLVIQLIFYALVMIAWPLFPIFPLVGLVLMITVGAPWKI